MYDRVLELLVQIQENLSVVDYIYISDRVEKELANFKNKFKIQEEAGILDLGMFLVIPSENKITISQACEESFGGFSVTLENVLPLYLEILEQISYEITNSLSVYYMRYETFMRDNYKHIWEDQTEYIKFLESHFDKLYQLTEVLLNLLKKYNSGKYEQFKNNLTDYFRNQQQMMIDMIPPVINDTTKERVYKILENSSNELSLLIKMADNNVRALPEINSIWFLGFFTIFSIQYRDINHYYISCGNKFLNCNKLIITTSSAENIYIKKFQKLSSQFISFPKPVKEALIGNFITKGFEISNFFETKDINLIYSRAIEFFDYITDIITIYNDCSHIRENRKVFYIHYFPNIRFRLLSIVRYIKTLIDKNELNPPEIFREKLNNSYEKMNQIIDNIKNNGKSKI